MQFTEAYSAVTAQIPKVPEFVIDSAFNRAARRFFEETEVHRQTFTVSTVKGQKTYTFTPSLGSSGVVISVTHKVYNVIYYENSTAKKLRPTTNKFATQTFGPSLYELNTPQYFNHTFGNSIDLFQTPQLGVSNALSIEVCVKPTRAATEIPDDLAERYFEGLVAGTVSEIARVPDTEFSNPKLFPVAEDYFISAIRDARAEATGADKNVPRKVRYGGY